MTGNSTIRYVFDPQKINFIISREVQKRVALLSQVLKKNEIIVYPDATFKSRGFPNGLAINCAAPDALLFPALLRDVGCGFLLFTIDLSSRLDVHWAQKIGVILNSLVTTKFAEVAGSLVNSLNLHDVLIYGLKALPFGVNNHSWLLKCSLPVDENVVSLSVAENMQLAQDLLTITNTLELKKIKPANGVEHLHAFNISTNDVVGFIHTGSDAMGGILSQKFFHSICDYSLAYGLFSLENVKQGIFGVSFKSALGKEYYEWLKAGMNYAIVKRYCIFHLLKARLEKILPCKVSLVNDVIHCGVLMEELPDGKTMVKAFRGVQPLKYTANNKINKSIALLAGQRETIAALVAGTEQSIDSSAMFSHGVSYNICSNFNYHQAFSTPEIGYYLALTKKSFCNSTPEYEKCIPYTYNFLASLNYFCTIGLLENVAYLMPLVNIRGTLDL